MHVAKRVSIWLLISLAALGLSIGGFALWCGKTAGGRRYLADRIAAVVSDNIPGRLEIGEVTEVSWLWLRARDVRFLHPDGRCVLHVEQAIVEPDLMDAFQARLSFRRVAAEGGSMLFSVDPDGRLSLEAAMDSPRRPGQPSDPKRGLHYDLRNMHVKDFKLKLQTGGMGDMQMNDVSGVVHVWRLTTVGTRVRLHDVRGSIAPEIVGAKLAVQNLDGLVTGAEAVVADVRARLSVDRDSALSLLVRYAPEHKEKLKIRVLDKDGTEATTLTWLLHAAASFSKDIRVDG
ncbi:MAG TPA: hypothetical protein VFN67_21995 [Polyangiales bacterium]|nr:hypothetical protein [Polyangiales bacterium]